ncbi:hypothetical protein [Rhizobium sp. Root1204]|uniref:DUF6894 family protein n=1 Tax=Rhizobium sp. Root1204 TaxID=1736428 RepID=UPI0007127135|nr:hypothetical protein [Rhizobium sp. Root1204]KQV31989.1 hypothetical protein ASC96_31075 [Rhizobium sp. Root1204]
MSSFQFRFWDRDGAVATDEIYEFRDLFAAVDEAKLVLAEMVLDGIPAKSGDVMAVEVVNADGVIAAKVGLTLSVDYPSA